jgi:hypothetical protein
VALVLLTTIKAWPLVGLADEATLRVELVPALDRLSTPAAPVLVLLKAYKLPTTEAVEVSLASLLSLPATEVLLA